MKQRVIKVIIKYLTRDLCLPEKKLRLPAAYMCLIISNEQW